MVSTGGNFVISLDFEIKWGVRIIDQKALDSYKQNLLGVQQVIPKTLEIFNRFGIKGTFAIVGFLFFETKEELLNHLPENQPQYRNPTMSPYGAYIEVELGSSQKDDPYHFAPHLIEMIRQAPGQEIGTHTFSHYFCLEEGQTIDSFSDDIKAAIAVAGKYGLKTTSIIFPRNQFNESYLQVCADLGIITYRNNEHSWLYAPRNSEEETLFRRSLRLVDSYLNITGHHCYNNDYMSASTPVNIPSSRFLRPYPAKLKTLEWLRLRRIKRGMTHAAKNGLTYHLWWHPHNFGINQRENFSFLEAILDHYKDLEKKYGFTSITMTDLAKQLLNHGT
ncbi:MAG: polysaccharide deacetylase family protein [Ferruginibacter sp.]|nr:polysaccharide deacetylase family protein [Ferruginibacter sp.]